MVDVWLCSCVWVGPRGRHCGFRGQFTPFLSSCKCLSHPGISFQRAPPGGALAWRERNLTRRTPPWLTDTGAEGEEGGTTRTWWTSPSSWSSTSPPGCTTQGRSSPPQLGCPTLSPTCPPSQQPSARCGTRLEVRDGACLCVLCPLVALACGVPRLQGVRDGLSCREKRPSVMPVAAASPVSSRRGCPTAQQAAPFCCVYDVCTLQRHLTSLPPATDQHGASAHPPTSHCHCHFRRWGRGRYCRSRRHQAPCVCDSFIP